MMYCRLVFLCVVLSFALGCGDNDASDNNGTNVDPEEQLAQACAAQPAAGDSCGGSQDCPVTECYCSDGSAISTQSCFNGTCLGRDGCDETCAGRGATNACDVDDSNASNTDGEVDNDSNGMTTGPTCDEDLSMFSDWAWGYNPSCLEENCCQQAAYCATFASCRAYDDCLLGCFDGGVADQDCIRMCRDQNTTEEFLMDAYAPFSDCAVRNGC